MKKPAIIAVLFACAAQAQQPAQCVNPEQVNGLIFRGSSELQVRVTRGLPAFMNGFRAPAGFTLIGSGVMASTITRVAYKTALAAPGAFTALQASLAAEGWKIEATPGDISAFRVAGSPGQATFCRDGQRRMVRVMEVSGISYATISNFPQASPRACDAPDPAMQMDFMTMRGAVPRFQFPAGTTIGQGSGSGGGNGSMYNTTSRIISGETATALVEHLAAQIAAQGWQPDSGWSGDRSAGSTWRRPGEDGPTWGTLEITRVSEGTFDVDFTMASP